MVLGLRLLGDTQARATRHDRLSDHRRVARPLLCGSILAGAQRSAFLRFEDGSLADGKGRIVDCEIYGYVGVAPRRSTRTGLPCVYSFPFVTEDQLLMVPETSDRSAIEVFRAKGFPGAFTRATLMKDCRLVDPTIVRSAGKLWLFAHTDPRVRSDFEGLHLFYADGVFGPWHPHPMNPVVCDAGSARPARRCSSSTTASFGLRRIARCAMAIRSFSTALSSSISAPIVSVRSVA